MDLEMRMKMKIIQFPVNIDKLTGFFDKYLKSNAGENETIIGFISNSYAVIFKQKKNILSKFIELKKILRPPHFPAPARICASGNH